MTGMPPDVLLEGALRHRVAVVARGEVDHLHEPKVGQPLAKLFDELEALAPVQLHYVDAAAVAFSATSSTAWSMNTPTTSGVVLQALLSSSQRFSRFFSALEHSAQGGAATWEVRSPNCHTVFVMSCAWSIDARAHHLLDVGPGVDGAHQRLADEHPAARQFPA
eukprot:CAMPEP_0179358924 /NCGR_PEP_ID=MMETSP0797-20121207/79181_1 /TAXON_ID=47934 /ORGANISM="Dinophysis acuminata, Strain DAEP01" /LENGTH=163 /DNA_ID=CAMNT_0021074201 /DNA_START=166 /DNA_END=654 /DNA_ORIENTATION=+